MHTLWKNNGENCSSSAEDRHHTDLEPVPNVGSMKCPQYFPQKCTTIFW